MKNILKFQTIFLFTILVITGCKKDEIKLTYDGGTPPVLSTVTGAEVSYDNADATALTLNWTNPEYMFNTGVSSLDVTYNIEIDTLGSDFTNPAKKVISISTDLSYSFTASDLNDIMQNQLNLAPNVEHTLDIRVVSSLANNSAQLSSNSVQYTATPYVIPPKVAPSPSGELFIIGAALTGNGDGWNNPVDASKYQFQKLDDLHYTLTVYLYGGQEYLFIPVNGDWSHKYACKNTADQPATGGDFGYDWSANFPAVASDGTYKIDVDFQKGKYTVTKQ